MKWFSSKMEADSKMHIIMLSPKTYKDRQGFRKQILEERKSDEIVLRWQWTLDEVG